jgi:hypothetical protein
MIQAPSTIAKVSTLADSTLRCVVDFQELSPESEAEIFRLRNKLGWFLFAEAPIKQEDIPTEPIEFSEDKTLDERLNAVLYAYHMKKTNDAKTFHTFRRNVYESIIEKYKDKLSEMN